MKATQEQYEMAAAMGRTPGGDNVPPASNLTLAVVAEWLSRVAARQKESFESLQHDREELTALQRDIEAFRRVIGTAR